MPCALITGISGQDGSYLAEQLLERGYRVVGLHRRLSAENHGRIAHLAGRLELVCADMLDLASLLGVLEEVHPDEIYNLAAQSFVPTSWTQPLLTGDVTALGALRLLEAARRVCPGARIYQASSSEMFGATHTFPQDEDTAFEPLSPYAVSKVFAHHQALIYREAYGLFVSCGILFNHESPRRGLEFVTRKVSDGVARIHLGLQDKIRLGNTEVRRDWGFAGDYTQAMQRMLRQDKPGTFVVATGEDHSVQEWVETAFAVVGRDWRDHVEIDERLFRKNEIARLCGNAGRAHEKLGWEPQMSFSGLVRCMVEADLERLS